jgi:hypothetical protein
MGLNPGLLRLWQLQSDALTTRLDLDERYYLFHSQHCKLIFPTKVCVENVAVIFTT